MASHWSKASAKNDTGVRPFDLRAPGAHVVNIRSLVNQYLTCGTMPVHVTLCGYLERQDKFSMIFWSEVNQQVIKNFALTRITSKLPIIWSMPGK